MMTMIVRMIPVLLLFPTTVGHSDDKQNSAVVFRKLREALQQVHSLHYKATIVSAFEEELIKQEGLLPDQKKLERKVCYWMKGVSYMYDIDYMTPMRDAQVGYKTGFNGSYFQFYFKHSKLLSIMAQDQENNSVLMGATPLFEPFRFLSRESDEKPTYALSFPNLKSDTFWLSRLADSVLAGEIVRGERRCAMVSVPGYTLFGKKCSFRVFVDMMLDGYPVGYDCVDENGSKVMSFDVLETGQYQLPEFVMLFPRKSRQLLFNGSGGLLRTIEWTITELEANKNIPDEIFTIDLSVPTKIYDSDAQQFLVK